MANILDHCTKFSRHLCTPALNDVYYLPSSPQLLVFKMCTTGRGGTCNQIFQKRIQSASATAASIQVTIHNVWQHRLIPVQMYCLGHTAFVVSLC